MCVFGSDHPRWKGSTDPKARVTCPREPAFKPGAASLGVDGQPYTPGTASQRQVLLEYLPFVFL
jgi:hypothetical protein